MTLTFPTIGQTPWGAPLNGALAKMASITLPDDHGSIAWTYDPALSDGSSLVPTGTLNLMRVPIRAGVSTVSVTMCSTVAGVTLTAGQNLMGLYSSAGVLVAQTADQTASWLSTGTKTMAWTGATPLAPGMYWVAMLTNGTTAPQIQRGQTNAANAINYGLTAANSRFGTFGAGLTALPASFSPAAITQAFIAFWAAVS